MMKMVNTIDKGMIAEDASIWVDFYVSAKNAHILQKILSVELCSWEIQEVDNGGGVSRRIQAQFNPKADIGVEI